LSSRGARGNRARRPRASPAISEADVAAPHRAKRTTLPHLPRSPASRPARRQPPPHDPAAPATHAPRTRTESTLDRVRSSFALRPSAPPPTLRTGTVGKGERPTSPARHRSADGSICSVSSPPRLASRPGRRRAAPEPVRRPIRYGHYNRCPRLLPTSRDHTRSSEWRGGALHARAAAGDAQSLRSRACLHRLLLAEASRAAVRRYYDSRLDAALSRRRKLRRRYPVGRPSAPRRDAAVRASALDDSNHPSGVRLVTPLITAGTTHASHLQLLAALADEQTAAQATRRP